MKEVKNINWKKIGLNLLYPHIAVIICLVPISAAFLTFVLIYLTPQSMIAILAYLLAFYALLVISFRVPRVVKYFKIIRLENKYVKRWFEDEHLRINITLYGSLTWNVAFAIFQLGLGFYHKSFWFFSMFAYYLMLGVMRFFLVNYTRKYKANEKRDVELKKYVLSGWLLLFMNLALAVIVFFMVYWNRTFYHHMITTIAIAAYTFVTFSLAIINLVRFRKYKSPVYSAAKIISLIAGCVSILTLETTMLTTFGTTESELFAEIILPITGAVVIGFAIMVAIMMISKGTKNLNSLNNEKQTTD